MEGIITEELGRQTEISEAEEWRGTARIVLIAKMEKLKIRWNYWRRAGRSGGIGA